MTPESYAYAVIACSCPDDHQVVAVYLTEADADRYADQFDGKIASKFSAFNLYTKRVPLNPDAKALRAAIKDCVA